jgi:hypothetical protein
MHPSSLSIFNWDSLIVQTLKIKFGNIPSLQRLIYTSFFVFFFFFFLFVGVALGELQKKMVGFGRRQSGEQAKGLGFNIPASIRNCIENPISGINQGIKADNHDHRPNQMPDSFYICRITVLNLNFLFPNTKNRLFFESDVFQLLRSDGYFYSEFFKYPEPEGIKKPPRIHSHHIVCYSPP